MRNWLEDLRKAKGISKAKLAEIVGLDISAIGKYERGERRPSPEKAKVIAATLDFDWTRFYEESPCEQ